MKIKPKFEKKILISQLWKRMEANRSRKMKPKLKR
jgi:hypothetical protein